MTKGSGRDAHPGRRIRISNRIHACTPLLFAACTRSSAEDELALSVPFVVNLTQKSTGWRIKEEIPSKQEDSACESRVYRTLYASGSGLSPRRVCYSPPADALPPALGSTISCAPSRASKSNSKTR